MTLMVVRADDNPRTEIAPDQRIRVMVNVQADVLDPELTRRKANVWLLENAGNLLGAENPELILGRQLLWRFDVVLGLPNLDEPGAGDVYAVGKIFLDAMTGQVQDTETLAEELRNHAASLAHPT